MIRTSEFWVAIATTIGSVVVGVFKLMTMEEWATYFWPPIVYVIGRLTSKVAKAVIAPAALILMLAGAASAEAVRPPTYPTPGAFSVHGNVGFAWYDTWQSKSSPRFSNLRPHVATSLYLGSKYGPKGLTLGGSLLFDAQRLEKGRLGSLGLFFEF